MSKKNKELENPAVEVAEETEVKEAQSELVADKKTPKTDKKDKKKSKKEQKQNKLAKKTKETFSELKKVSWPSFGKTMKQTGMVISVVIIFMLLIMGIDQLLIWLLSLC